MGMVKQAMYFSWGLLLTKVIEQYYKYEGEWHIQLVFDFEKVDMTDFKN